MADNVKKPVQKAAKTALNPGESEDYFGILSIATIAKRVDIDRATVKKRLDEHKITAVETRQKLKLYEFDEALEALLLETDTKFNEARTRKAMADADLVEMKVKQAQGELVPFGEAVEAIGATFGALYKELAVRQPKRLAARLAKATTASDITAILAADTDKIFQDIRANPTKFLAADKTARAA